MRKVLAIGLLVLAGCQNLVGPLEHRQPLRVDDPRFPVEEQERRSRDRLALPDAADRLAPRLYFLPPNTGTGTGTGTGAS
jgi:hypothetical protein